MGQADFARPGPNKPHFTLAENEREREDSALSNADLVHEDVVAVVHPDAVKKLKLREGKEKRRGGGERSFCVNCPAEMPALAGGTVFLSYGKGASITPELSVEVRGRRKKATSLTRERETTGDMWDN